MFSCTFKIFDSGALAEEMEKYPPFSARNQTKVCHSYEFHIFFKKNLILAHAKRHRRRKSKAPGEAALCYA